MEQTRKQNILIVCQDQKEVHTKRLEICRELTAHGIDNGGYGYCLTTPKSHIFMGSYFNLEYVVQGRRFDAVFDCPDDLYNKWVISHRYDGCITGDDPIKYLVGLEKGTVSDG